jgi:hypothetical protein
VVEKVRPLVVVHRYHLGVSQSAVHVIAIRLHSHSSFVVVVPERVGGK